MPEDRINRKIYFRNEIKVNCMIFLELTRVCIDNLQVLCKLMKIVTLTDQVLFD